MPVAFPAQPSQDCVFRRYTELYQFADAFLRPAPLFQVAHADASSQPLVYRNSNFVIQGNTEVVHPSMSVGTDFPVPVVHRNAPTTASETAQFGLKACERFLRDSKPFSDEGKTEERTLLGFDHFAFVSVDLHLEDFLKETADTFHYAISRTFGLGFAMCGRLARRLGLVCGFCPSSRTFALRLPSDGRSPFRPCLRLVLLLVSIVMNTFRFSYRGLSPLKFTPVPGVPQEAPLDRE